jgi:transcriptional regulator with XRE-family HTH domain
MVKVIATWRATTERRGAMADLAYIGPGGRTRRPRPLLRTMIGDVLRRNRTEQGRTLADVARAAKVSLPYLSEVERGRKEVSSEVLAAVCDALRIELADVLTEVGCNLARDRTERVPAVAPLGLHRRPVSPYPGRPVAPPARRPGDVVLLAA